MKEEEEDEGEIVEETVDILLEVTEEFVDWACLKCKIFVIKALIRL